MKTLNYETPRIGSAKGDDMATTLANLNLHDGPLEEEEKFRLADMRLKEIFTSYSKQYSSTGGKTLTFD